MGKKRPRASTTVALVVLYFLHALMYVGDRMWFFAVGLYLVDLSPGSLRLSGIYGLVNSGAAVLFGSAVGRWVDRTPRIKAAQRSLVLQNTMTAVSALLLTVHFAFSNLEYWHQLVLRIGIVFSAVVAQLASTATSIAVTKDWIKVIAAGDTQRLATLNAAVRRIDLACFLLAPVLVSQLMALSNYVSSMALVAWNLLSLVAEYALLRAVYNRVPALQEPKNAAEDRKSSSLGFLSAWKLYRKQETFPAGLALALLYMTVLGFDNITVGYVFIQGVPESLMGIMPALAGLVGMVGTLAYPRLTRTVGLERTGLVGFGSEVTCLTLALASLWAPGTPFKPEFLFADRTDVGSNQTTATVFEEAVPQSYASVILLLAGIVTARFGLWIADLTVTQFQQELVPSGDLGAVNGVQHSLNMTLDMVKFGLVVLLPRPETFGYLAMLSFCSVVSGWASFAVFSKRRRGHILPFHNVKCIAVLEDDNENTCREVDYHFGVRI